ncbi:MAG: glutamate-5-semialdehyde dehydrogenase [Actinomycetota bacterium]|nr:glutamate-5-semialdehyde dehydrogenase [Actinomycetota bacterium]
MATTERTVSDALRSAKAASLELQRVSTEAKNSVLVRLAVLLRERSGEVLEANAADLADERAAGLTQALRDRLALTPERVEAMAEGVEAIASLPDPVGEEIESGVLSSGLAMQKMRVPLGVVAVIYEARPNVTIDCAALCLKSGNAIVLRGSSYAERSNAALAALVREALADSGLAEGCAELLSGDREELAALATADGLVDLVIPRGGGGLKAALSEVATVPVMYAAAGVCHVYVHADADLEMAARIAVNAKVQRPGVCNAAETLLVDGAVAAAFVPAVSSELADAGVELVGDERARANADGVEMDEATDVDWDTEYHDLKLSIGVVDGVDEAVEHINRHGTGHSDAIVTASREAAEVFTSGVDSACVYVNASTRFTDGFELGMGAEIGNSTQKLHARGPIGMRELTTYKYVMRGTGQIRG